LLVRTSPAPHMWTLFLVRTPGRAHRRLKRRRCTQARQSPPPDWCVWSGAHGSKSAPALRCCRTACLKTLPGMSTPPQRSIPKSPPLWPPSRTELGMGRALHLRTTPQLFTAHAGRQSLSGVLSPGCSQQGSPPAAQHTEIASYVATNPHGALHGSCLTTVQQPEPGPCPSRPQHAARSTTTSIRRAEDPSCQRRRPSGDEGTWWS
jgi:hypothetical protein